MARESTTYRSLALRAARAELFADLYATAATAVTEQELLEYAVVRIAEALGDAACVLTLSPDRRWFDLAAWHAKVPEQARFIHELSQTRLRADEGVAGRVLSSQQPFVVTEAGSRPETRTAGEATEAPWKPEYVPFLARFGINSLLAAPLASDGRVFGALEIARTGANHEPFTDEDLAFLARLTGPASVFNVMRDRAERIREQEERERDARRAEVIAEFVQSASDATHQEAVLADLAQAASDAVEGSLAVYRIAAGGRELEAVALKSHDEVADEFRKMYAVQRWRTDEGLMGLALATRQTVFRPYLDAAERAAYLSSLPDDRRPSMAERDLRAIIAIPLSDGDRQLGILTLARYGEGTQPFTERDRAFAETLAARANVALARLELAAERERESRALAASAALFGTLTTESPIATVVFNAADKIELWNRAAEELFGWRAEEVLGLTRNPWVPDEASEEADELDRRGRAGEVIRGLELRRRRKDGSPIDILFYQAPFRDSGGDIAGFVVRAIDITERKRLERELRETSETLRAILDASPLAIQAVDLDRRVTFWSRGSERLYGWTAGEVIGATPPYLIADEPDPLAPLLPQIARGESGFADEVRRRTKSGEIAVVRIFAAPVFDAEGRVTGMLGIHEDLRARRELEAELRETSATLGAILEATPVAVVTVDPEMRVSFWNRAAERMYGWSAEEVVGGPPPYAPADDPSALVDMFDRIRSGETVAAEVRRQTKAGQLLDVRVLNTPLFDAEGRLRGGLSVQEDITERKRLENQLLQAQKMETVGRLAGGVAHDFNNILTAIIGYADIARTIAAERDVQSALGTIKTAAERAAGLTQQLLAFSRRQMLQPEVVDANEAVLGMEAILRRLIGEDIDLVTSVTPDVGSVLVDRTQLEQVILNLAINARDAMPDGGRLVIATEHIRMNGDHTHVEMAPGSYVVISVTDSGIGMDEETKTHIFEPFFTTKEVGKGTGLGLATTYGIVRQSGGYIWVYSELGRGSTFKLYFPAVGAQEGVAQPPDAHAPARSGRILLVEDDATLRDLARVVLTRSGFTVTAARTPDEALSLARDETFDVLVTDIVMPGMTGVELCRRLRGDGRQLPVLFMSGYAEDMTDVQGQTNASFLAKPFTPDSLLRAVDTTLTVDRQMRQ